MYKWQKDLFCTLFVVMVDIVVETIAVLCSKESVINLEKKLRMFGEISIIWRNFELGNLKFNSTNIDNMLNRVFTTLNTF